MSDTFVSTTLEAMASGLPSVVADGASASIVLDGECGLVVPTEPKEDEGRSMRVAMSQRNRQHWIEERFFNATAALVQDRSLRSRMGKAARKRAEQHFQWPVVNSAMLKYYDEVDHTNSSFVEHSFSA